MDKPRSHKRKPLNLKNVRKFALEHFKRIKEQKELQTQQQSNGAGSSRSAVGNTTFSITSPPSTSKATEGQRPNNTDRYTESYSNTDNNKTSYFNNKLKRNLPTTPISSFKFKQHQRRLINHKYTDVVVDRVEVKRMANNLNHETKPLTQPHITQKPKIQPKYDVHRDVLTHEVVIKETGYGARDKSIPYALRQCWQNWSFLSLFTGIIPILQWLPKYSWKRDLIGDIIAGITVAIMAIPHGMAYGLLAGVGPGNGLYMGIFPVLVYMVLGTSRHISIGTFSVVSMMTLKVVQTYATEDIDAIAPAGSVAATATENIITPLQLVTTLAFTVGIVHLIMGFFRLGTLASLLSDPLVNGFTTGAACHVVTSQLKDVFGVTVPRYKGAFKIVFTVFDVAKSIPETNVAALIFCVCIIIFMTISNELLKPCLSKKCRFPLPSELVAVVGGTLISRYMHVNESYGIKLVGDIPAGLPMPELPRFDLIPMVTLDSIAIAIVSYSIIMSMGFTFAKKHSYEINPNQELFATGIGNLVSSCFACIPLACSLSRSVIQEQTGGATQLASSVAAGLMVIVLLWVGPFFSTLPRCVLAGVIIVALKPMFMQAKELKKFARQGKLELLTWVCTFCSVVIIDIDYGLLIGIAVSLLTLYIKGLKPYSALLGTIAGAEAVYVDLSHHRNAVELPDVKIFRYTGSLNFATNLFFRNALYSVLGIDGRRIRRASYMQIHQNGVENGHSNQFRCLVLDFTMLGHIDVAGCHTVSEIMKELNVLGVRIFLASPTDRVYDTIMHSMALGEGPFEIFPTLHDAVIYANAVRTA